VRETKMATFSCNPFYREMKHIMGHTTVYSSTD